MSQADAASQRPTPTRLAPERSAGSPSGPPEIQPVFAGQAQALADLHHAVFPPPEAWGADAFALQLAMPGGFAFLAEAAGMIVARIAADEAEVLTLAVLPTMRRRGLARALLHAAMAEAKRRGAASMVLEVAVHNATALALYCNIGFTRIGLRRRYYVDGSDALVLRAAL